MAILFDHSKKGRERESPSSAVAPVEVPGMNTILLITILAMYVGDIKHFYKRLWIWPTSKLGQQHVLYEIEFKNCYVMFRSYSIQTFHTCCQATWFNAVLTYNVPQIFVFDSVQQPWSIWYNHQTTRANFPPDSPCGFATHVKTQYLG